MADQLLFACGTLQLEKVHVALFNRVIDYDEDALPGHAVRIVVLENAEILAVSGTATHSSMIPCDEPGASVPGRALRLSDAELAILDKFQSEHHRRTRVTLASGREAWAYLGSI